MSELKVRLTKKQIQFLVEMLEIEDSAEVVKKFAQIMVEEEFPPKEMSKVIDIIMESRNKK